MFSTGCQDGSVDVAMAAMDAASALVSAIADEPEIMHFTGVITPMVTVMQRYLPSEEHEDIVVKGLNVLQECISNDQPLINDFIPVITSCKFPV
jgi:hypothetical protein